MSSLLNSERVGSPHGLDRADASSSRQALRRSSVAGFAGRRGFWGLSDQAVVSAGNFATNIFLARYLNQHDFGCFALLFDIILILNSFTAAVIWYPLSVRGSAGGRGRIRRYTTASIVLTSCALIPLGAAIVITTGLMTHQLTVAACAAAALVGWQLQETARRGLTAQCRFFDAIWGDAFSYSGQAVILLALGILHRLNLETAFATICLTSLAGFAVQCVQVGLKPMRWSKLATLSSGFWQSGRWMFLTSLASIVSVQAFSWALAIFSGLLVLADYQSLVNLLRVGNPIIAGISGVMLPAAARARSRDGMRAAGHAALRYTAQGAALLMPFYLLLLIWPRQIMALVYGPDSPYLGLTQALRVYVAANVLFFFAQMILTFMSAVERTRAVFWVQCATMTMTVLVSLPLTACFGLRGVVAGVAVSVLTAFAAAVYWLRSVNWSESVTGSPVDGGHWPHLPTLSAA
jgi:O-antigen/teichoic acid export membrane protein